MMRCGDRTAPAKRRALERITEADRSLSRSARPGLRGRAGIGRRQADDARRGGTARTRSPGGDASRDPGRERRRRRARCAWTRCRPRPRLRRPGAAPARDARAAPDHGQDRARSISRPRRRAAAGQHADPDDRPRALLRRVHRQVQPGAPAGRARPARADSGRGSARRSPARGSEQLEAYRAWTGLFDKVEVAFGRESAGLEVNRGDCFIATTWWTAHLAHQAVARPRNGERFVYLIQEYEPFTFPMGTWAAWRGRRTASPTPRCSRPSCCGTTSAAARSASTRRGPRRVTRHRRSFQNAITPVDPPSIEDLAPAGPAACCSTRGRSSTPRATCSSSGCWRWTGRPRHGVLPGGMAVSDGRRSAGGSSAAGAPPSSCSRARARTSTGAAAGTRRGPRADGHPPPKPRADGDGLRGHVDGDQHFENKTDEALRAISANLIPVEPTIDGVAAGLAAAAAGVEDVERRVAGGRGRLEPRLARPSTTS